MPNAVVKSYAEKTGKSAEHIEGWWKEAEAEAKKKFKKKGSRFWAYVNGIVKRRAGLSEETTFKEFLLLESAESFSKSLPKGSQEEFLANLGIPEDEFLLTVHEAQEKAKTLPSFKALKSAGLTYRERHDAKFGSFVFDAIDSEVDEKFKKLTYVISANGYVKCGKHKIGKYGDKTVSVGFVYRTIGTLKTPIKDTPMETLVDGYNSSFRRLLEWIDRNG